jgi:phosphate:Na+ symporter
MNLIKKMILPVILLMMAYAFWQNSNSKQIAAGVAIFLFGMLAIEDGFQRLSGGILERFLRSSTNRLWKSLNFGIITTSLMQSSSLVSILTISFLSAGLIDLAAGIGIIFGANLGTTTGAWLLAGFGLNVKLSVYAMPMLAFGIVLIFQSNNKLKAVGWVISGIGFLFMGIQYMKDGFDVMKDSIDLAAYAMTGIKGLLLYALLGIVVTVVMQSSHATLVLIITALATNQISYENALALSIGANVGTTITAIIGSISANIDGRRLAGAHLIFNMTTAIVAILLMQYIMIAVEWLGDKAHLAPDNYTLRLAIFHTLFNLLGVILVAPFIKPLVKFLHWLLPEKGVMIKQPKFLSPAVLESSHASVMAVKQESQRLYNLSLKVIANGIGLQKAEMLETVTKANIGQYSKAMEHRDINEEYATRIKNIFSAIVEFVVLARENISGKHAKTLQIYSRAVRELAMAIKAIKHLQKNLLINIKSTNIEVKYLYNELRWMIINTVREIEQIRVNGDDGKDKNLYKGLQKSITRQNTKIIKEIENNIRKQFISARTSTSLITDTEYTHRACINLIDAAKKLFVENEGVEQQKTEVTQDQNELEEILHEA